MATWSRHAADLGRTRPPQRSGRVRYLAIRYTAPLADESAVTSVGSKGDSYDKALTESVNGLYKDQKFEVISPAGFENFFREFARYDRRGPAKRRRGGRDRRWLPDAVRPA